MNYRVTHHTEEFVCPHCGGAVYVGDTAFETSDESCYCSRGCADAEKRRWGFRVCLDCGRIDYVRTTSPTYCWTCGSVHSAGLPDQEMWPQ